MQSVRWIEIASVPGRGCRRPRLTRLGHPSGYRIATLMHLIFTQPDSRSWLHLRALPGTGPLTMPLVTGTNTYDMNDVYASWHFPIVWSNPHRRPDEARRSSHGFVTVARASVTCHVVPPSNMMHPLWCTVMSICSCRPVATDLFRIVHRALRSNCPCHV